MKKCPYCAEKIQDEAIICRYCGNNLRDSIIKTRINNYPVFLLSLFIAIFISLYVFFTVPQSLDDRYLGLFLNIGIYGIITSIFFWMIRVVFKKPYKPFASGSGFISLIVFFLYLMLIFLLLFYPFQLPKLNAKSPQFQSQVIDLDSTQTSIVCATNRYSERVECISWEWLKLNECYVGKTVCVFGIADSYFVSKDQILINFRSDKGNMDFTYNGDFYDYKDKCIYISGIVRDKNYLFLTDNELLNNMLENSFKENPESFYEINPATTDVKPCESWMEALAK